jgi:hypothetical protein
VGPRSPELQFKVYARPNKVLQMLVFKVVAVLSLAMIQRVAAALAMLTAPMVLL